MLDDLFSKDGVLANLANSYATGLANNASKPKPVQVVNTPAPAAAVADNSKKYLMIGGGVLAAVMVLVLALKKG